MSVRDWVVLAGGLLASCGGGGGGSAVTAFAIVRTVPEDGTTNFVPEAELSVVFSTSPDVSTLTLDTLAVLRADGTQVPTVVVTAGSNPRTVWVRPEFGLDPDGRYRFLVKGTIRSKEGDPLGTDTEICFYTGGPEPTVREDQILDLGDRLNVPRYLAETVRIGSRVFVIGGYRSATQATDTIEEWNPLTRSFDLLPVTLLAPRAEFTATNLPGGLVMIAGGVDAPGGVALNTTEILDPSNGSSPGPPLRQARRLHAACPFRGGGVLVSGGIGAVENTLDTLEYYEDGLWHPHADRLEVPTAQHTQLLFGFDDVYVTGGNGNLIAARVSSTKVDFFYETDARSRAAGRTLPDGRAIVVAGDARSIVIRDFAGMVSWLARAQLADRRGEHSLTSWGSSGTMFLAAGGFQISSGNRVLTSIELVEYVPAAGGRPDANVYTVTASELPVGMAGHVGFNDPGGASVLAGGIGDGVGDHLRRVVMVLDDRTSPSVSCK